MTIFITSGIFHERLYYTIEDDIVYERLIENILIKVLKIHFINYNCLLLYILLYIIIIIYILYIYYIYIYIYLLLYILLYIIVYYFGYLKNCI